MRDIRPDPLRRIRTARSSIYSGSFKIQLPYPQVLSPKSSFIPRACDLGKILPSSFPEFLGLSSLKSKINELDFIPSPLSLSLSPLLEALLLANRPFLQRSELTKRDLMGVFARSQIADYYVLGDIHHKHHRHDCQYVSRAFCKRYTCKH